LTIAPDSYLAGSEIAFLGKKNWVLQPIVARAALQN